MKAIKYDLKGSSNRFVNNSGCSSTLHDDNFLINYPDHPLALSQEDRESLMACILKDTEFLLSQNIVDYSLIVIIHENKIRFGIIDYIQPYTFNKMIESKVKKFMRSGEKPTIIYPKGYKIRFYSAISTYFVGL